MRSQNEYQKLLGLSLQFYEAQMSGALPSWNSVLSSKPGGWRKDAHLKDGASAQLDLVGGFYDAGGGCGISACSSEQAPAAQPGALAMAGCMDISSCVSAATLCAPFTVDRVPGVGVHCLLLT